MQQQIANIALVVREYDEAIAWYRDKLGFSVIEDTPLSPTKRWVLMSPPGSSGTRLLLARAKNDEEQSRIGNQTGGRVFLFLFTDDFQRDYAAYSARGVEFIREVATFDYGTVSVFKDLYGNLWDLIEPAKVLSQ
ncbi:MAG: VOC family protein [Saprospiraceae bacterium]|nr:VOC family protein [Saprospiraceae bacterium]